MAKNQKILVVEDNDFVRMQITKFLESEDYICLEATNVSDAMRYAETDNAIVCMLVDVRMEPEDGFDFLNKIKALDVSIPSILVTGDQNTDILSKASNLGVASVLMKPINRDRLLKMVDRAIASSGRS